MKKSKNKIDFKYNLKEYFGFVKKYKGWLTLLIIATILVEGLAAVDKFLFKKIIDDGTEFAIGTLSSNAFTQILLVCAAIFVVVIIFRPIFRWLTIYFVNVIDAHLIKDLKKKYIRHILELSHNFHTTHKTGSLISRINRGTGAIETMTDAIIFNFSPLIIQVAIVATSLIYFNMGSALILFLIMVSFISYSIFIQNKQQESKLDFENKRDLEKGMVSDIFTNVDSIKYFGKEKYISKKHTAFSDKVKKAGLRYWKFYCWFDWGQAFIIGLGTFFLLLFPILNFLHGEITLGTLVFIYTIYGNVVSPMYSFVWGIRGYYRAMADFQDLFEYGKISNDIKDAPNAKNLEINKGGINFENISFTYKKRRCLFKNFSLKIKPHEKVAFVGHSGCGKTTLLKLIYRLYDVDNGNIKIDGQDISKIKQESLRNSLSIVPQECILFDDTIYNNIAFANPKAKKKEVWKAIRFAQLDKIINDFPKKEKTIVGERGVKLSGGEKQRVSIARAILANKKVLILDEATSSLDSETEYEIQKDLNKLLNGRTSIIIAHRLSTIMNADRIIVMKKGKIVQQGKHADLIKEEGEYKHLWNLQKGGYIK